MKNLDIDEFNTLLNKVINKSGYANSFTIDGQNFKTKSMINTRLKPKNNIRLEIKEQNRIKRGNIKTMKLTTKAKQELNKLFSPSPKKTSPTKTYITNNEKLQKLFDDLNIDINKSNNINTKLNNINITSNQVEEAFKQNNSANVTLTFSKIIDHNAVIKNDIPRTFYILHDKNDNKFKKNFLKLLILVFNKNESKYIQGDNLLILSILLITNNNLLESALILNTLFFNTENRKIIHNYFDNNILLEFIIYRFYKLLFPEFLKKVDYNNFQPMFKGTSLQLFLNPIIPTLLIFNEYNSKNKTDDSIKMLEYYAKNGIKDVFIIFFGYLLKYYKGLSKTPEQMQTEYEKMYKTKKIPPTYEHVFTIQTDVIWNGDYDERKTLYYKEVPVDKINEIRKIINKKFGSFDNFLKQISYEFIKNNIKTVEDFTKEKIKKTKKGGKRTTRKKKKKSIKQHKIRNGWVLIENKKKTRKKTRKKTKKKRK